MAPCGKRPLLLLLDWDGTLTVSSTLALIASISTYPATHPSLADLSAAYSEDLRCHDKCYIPRKQHRKAIQQELTYLSSLNDVEKASIERIEASEIFKDVQSADIEFAAVKAFEEREVTLRSGWNHLIKSVQMHENGKVAVVSVAWSRRVISTVLREANGAAGGNGVAIEDLIVKANEIAGNGSGSLGRCFSAAGRGIWTAADKATVMDQLVDENALRGERDVTKPFTIYLGDSPTDLACLLKADVGICIRDSPLTSEQLALEETLQRLGLLCLNVKHLDSVAEDLEKEDERHVRRSLWSAKDFHEVLESRIFDGDRLVDMA